MKNDHTTIQDAVITPNKKNKQKSLPAMIMGIPLISIVINQVMVAGSKFEGFVSNEIAGLDTSNPVLIDYKKQIRGKSGEVNDRLLAFYHAIVLMMAWCSGKNCCNTGDKETRGKLIRLAKDVFGPAFEQFATLPVVISFRHKSNESVIEIIAVDLAKIETAEDDGHVLMTFRGDKAVINHFMEVAGEICTSKDKKCVNAIVFAD